MQNIIIDKPYQFVPPCDSRLWPALLHLLLPGYLRRSFGFEKIECRGVEHLRKSLDAGHGIVIAPNHCRPSDPMIMGMLSHAAGCRFFMMASWHVFMQNALQTWVLRRAGAFSVYREGMDKSALSAAIEIIEQARRPLVIFPEGIVSRTNDHLNPLMEGTSFIARSAAKKRQKQNPEAKVVVHPVALNYFYKGDIHKTSGPVLDEIERRLSWRPQRDLPLVDRIYKCGAALLSLKEIEYLGQPQTGEIKDRLRSLIDRILSPLEKEYTGGRQEPNVIARVKKLRSTILPDMIGQEMSEEERARRWRQLADLYLAQQLDFYPGDYVKTRPTPERILETIERFEEDLTDTARVHAPMHAIIQVGEAIEVNAERDRKNPVDPVMQKLEEQLRGMLERTAAELTVPISVPEAIVKSEPVVNASTN